MKHPSPARHGFSLVELSIVLVILGLLTGGILTGQSLIRAAELRSVITEFQRFQVATHTFREKYFAMPGDMRNATAFWTSAGGDGTNATCVNAQSNASNATCNGNGDGRVGTAGTLYSERFTAWKHLANAGLVEGNYSGKTTGASGTWAVTAGVNVPASKNQNGIYDLYFAPCAASELFLAAKCDITHITHFIAYPTPEETWSMDQKLDDGSPVYGRFNVHRPSSVAFPNNCASSDAASAVYNVSNKSAQCLIHLNID